LTPGETDGTSIALRQVPGYPFSIGGENVGYDVLPCPNPSKQIKNEIIEKRKGSRAVTKFIQRIGASPAPNNAAPRNTRLDILENLVLVSHTPQILENR
jgi:hypothetical protein